MSIWVYCCSINIPHSNLGPMTAQYMDLSHYYSARNSQSLADRLACALSVELLCIITTNTISMTTYVHAQKTCRRSRRSGCVGPGQPRCLVSILRVLRHEISSLYILAAMQATVWSCGSIMPPIAYRQLQIADTARKQLAESRPVGFWQACLWLVCEFVYRPLIV